MNKARIVNMFESTGHFKHDSPNLILSDHLPPFLGSITLHAVSVVSSPSQFEKIIIKVALLTQLTLDI